MSQEIDKAILEAVHRQADARADLIEEYCEKSLVDPEGRGVLVREYWPEFRVTAELSDKFPYAEVHIQQVYEE